MVNNKMVDINGLQRYHNNLKGILADNLAEAKQHANNLADNYDEKGAAAQALADAKADAANLYQVKGNYETEGAAAQALADAKADAAEKYQVKGDYEESGAAAQALEAANAYADSLAVNYDAAGAAAQALTDAKADAASLYQVKGDYEVAGTAAGLNEAMNERVAKLEAIDHDKLAADAAASAVTTVLDDAPEAFDTLKEVAEWIGNNDHAADVATLVTDVANLKAIDHTAYVAADETNLAAAKAYADSLAINYDAAGAATSAEQNAKNYADSLAGNYDEAGAAAQALAEAKADAESKYQVKGDYATTAQVNAKQDAIDDLATIRANAELGKTALQAVPEEYVTETELTAKGYLTANDLIFAEDGDIDALFATPL